MFYRTLHFSPSLLESMLPANSSCYSTGSLPLITANAFQRVGTFCLFSVTNSPCLLFSSILKFGLHLQHFMNLLSKYFGFLSPVYVFQFLLGPPVAIITDLQLICWLLYSSFFLFYLLDFWSVPLSSFCQLTFTFRYQYAS